MTSAAYSNKELSLALLKKGIEAHRVMQFEEGGGWYYRYTYDIICRWLREVHNLSVEVYRTACGYVGCVVAIPSGTDIKFIEGDGDDLPSGQYTTHEKACEAAIWYCINNLI